MNNNLHIKETDEVIEKVIANCTSMAIDLAE